MEIRRYVSSIALRAIAQVPHLAQLPLKILADLVLGQRRKLNSWLGADSGRPAAVVARAFFRARLCGARKRLDQVRLTRGATCLFMRFWFALCRVASNHLVIGERDDLPRPVVIGRCDLELNVRLRLGHSSRATCASAALGPPNAPSAARSKRALLVLLRARPTENWLRGHKS